MILVHLLSFLFDQSFQHNGGYLIEGMSQLDRRIVATLSHSSEMQGYALNKKSPRAARQGRWHQKVVEVFSRAAA
jgi:hypothetical protein